MLIVLYIILFITIIFFKYLFFNLEELYQVIIVILIYNYHHEFTQSYIVNI